MANPKVTGETSWKETKFGIVPRSAVIKLEIQGTRKGLLFLREIALRKEPLSIDLLLRTHKECFGDILQDRAGVFRTVQVKYSGTEAPHYSKIRELMQNLIKDTEYSLTQIPEPSFDHYISEIVEIAALFQHRFVVIHPFLDYNGRLSRMFTNYLLMREELPAIEIPVTTVPQRKKYIRSLQQADNGDYTMLRDIISRALNESLIAVNK